MKKTHKRLISLFMAIVMCCTMVIPAFAENNNLFEYTKQVLVETTAGKEEQVTINVSETRTETDGVTVTESTASATNVITAGGMTVNYDETSKMSGKAGEVPTGTASSHYTSESANGLYIAEGGSESIVKKVLPGASVEIPLTSDKENDKNKRTAESSIAKDPVVEDPRKDANDGIYDYTEYISQKKGKLTVTTNNVTATQVVTTDDDTVFQHVYGTALPYEGSESKTPAPYTPGTTDYERYHFYTELTPGTKVEIPEGYDHMFIKSGTVSHFWPARLFTSPSSNSEKAVYSDPNTGISYYTNRKHSDFTKRSCTLDWIYPNANKVTKAEGADPFVAWYDSAQFFLITDHNGNWGTTYCADNSTPTVHGWYYTMENVEDADYYTPENAKKIRAVAERAYWATENGEGSLAAFKQMLTDSQQFTEDEVNRVTEGIAMVASQISVWNFSNHNHGRAFVGAYKYEGSGRLDEKYDEDGNLISHQASEEENDLIFKIVKYLTQTEFEDKGEHTTSNTIINTRNFLGKADITLKGEDIANNKYIADISFSLKVRPRGAQDNLLVTITDADNNVIAEGRVAGTVGEGEIDLSKTVDNNGAYHFTDVSVPTDLSQTLNFYIKGEQYLEHGVYLYTSEIKDDPYDNSSELIPSQTLVGMASGPRSVSVKLSVDFKFEIEEETIKEHTLWRREKTLPTPAVSFSAKKVLTGRELKENDFTFSLYRVEEPGVEIPADVEPIETVGNTAGRGEVNFSEIKFEDGIGEYYYAIVENNDGKGGIKYDENPVRYVMVEVYKDENGGVQAKTTYMNADCSTTDTIVFNNSYEIVTPDSVTIQGHKRFVDVAGNEMPYKEFTFVLEPVNEMHEAIDAPAFTATNDKNGNFVFTFDEIDTEGVWHYVLREVAGNDSAITYDNNKYYVTISAIDNGDGTITAKKEIVDAEGNVVDKFTRESKGDFVNTHNPPPPPEVPDTGDNTGLMTYAAIFGAAMLALAVIILIKRKKREE